MVLRDFKCEKCKRIFESTEDSATCCGEKSKKIVSLRGSATTFSHKVYPFYHLGIGEVVHSEKDLNEKCEKSGFMSQHEGAYMTPKHERLLMDHRVEKRPRYLVEQVKWSGKGADLPTIETVETSEE